MTNREKQIIQDRNVINYLQQFKAATTDTLATLFFSSLLMAQRRLKKLATEYKVINRDRDHISQQYYYYIDRPKQITHRLLLTNFHREITRLGIKVVKFENEFTYFENIRPDGFLACELPNKSKMVYFIETEISNRPDTKKYEKLYSSEDWKKIFPLFPTIIWVTNRNVPKTNLKTVHLREDLSNIHLLCRD